MNVCPLDEHLSLQQNFLSYFLLAPPRNLTDCENPTKGLEARTLFTRRTEQHCGKLPWAKLAREPRLDPRGSPKTPWGSPQGFRHVGSWLPGTHSQRDLVLFPPWLQQPKSALTYQAARGSPKEINAGVCGRSRSPTWKPCFQHVKVGAGSFLSLL